MRSTASRLRVLQNNKALKLSIFLFHFVECLRVLQNNKALKHFAQIDYQLLSLRVLQNNKALKPNISPRNVILTFKSITK